MNLSDLNQKYPRNQRRFLLLVISTTIAAPCNIALTLCLKQFHLDHNQSAALLVFLEYVLGYGLMKVSAGVGGGFIMGAASILTIAFSFFTGALVLFSIWSPLKAGEARFLAFALFCLAVNYLFFITALRYCTWIRRYTNSSRDIFSGFLSAVLLAWIYARLFLT